MLKESLLCQDIFLGKAIKKTEILQAGAALTLTRFGPRPYKSYFKGRHNPLERIGRG